LNVLAHPFVAYLLMALWLTGAAGVIGWKVYHSRGRIAAREAARRRRAEAAHVGKFAGENRDG
jgi:hypothetical protein